MSPEGSILAISFSVLGILGLFSIGAIVYVYRFRGTVRWNGFGEYVRKGWPIFAPLNCLLYLFTERRAARPIMNMQDFPELTLLQDNWKIISEEAINLQEQKYFEQTNKPDTTAFYDLGFRTFYKYGWSKFYLKWYGHTHESARRLCPNTVEVLSRVPVVKGAMFSVLPAGSKLTRHLDPMACSLRYHLGLATPNENECYISIDGIPYSWRDGEAFMFDETYLHHAHNGTSHCRVIMMCDVARPMSSAGRLINLMYSGLARMTVVPNMDGDKRGAVNILFAALAPVLKGTKSIKQSNRTLYLAIKYFVNTAMVVLFMSVVAVLAYVIATLAGSFSRMFGQS